MFSLYLVLLILINSITKLLLTLYSKGTIYMNIINAFAVPNQIHWVKAIENGLCVMLY